MDIEEFYNSLNSYDRDEFIHLLSSMNDITKRVKYLENELEDIRSKIDEINNERGLLTKHKNRLQSIYKQLKNINNKSINLQTLEFLIYNVILDLSDKLLEKRPNNLLYRKTQIQNELDKLRSRQKLSNQILESVIDGSRKD